MKPPHTRTPHLQDHDEMVSPSFLACCTVSRCDILIKDPKV